jgi:hypothetical protein
MKTMTENEATEWVYDQDEQGSEIDQEALEAAFAALYGRAADDQDRRDGLWSLCCAATPNCGTRPMKAQNYDIIIDQIDGELVEATSEREAIAIFLKDLTLEDFLHYVRIVAEPTGESAE